MASLIPLFSSSAGNCILVGGAAGGVLIDAGVSAKRIAQALAAAQCDAQKIAAVFVTHEHNDHVAGLRVLCERHHIPVFATPGTLEFLAREGKISAKMQVQPMPAGGVEAGGLLVRAFKTSHDASEPCGFCCEDESGHRTAVATDTGCITEETRAALLGCDTVMLESNHEVTMLQNGGYPYWLKRRILGDQGHLSNVVCASFLPALLQRGAGRFFLGHLSRENNTPALARATATAAFDAMGARKGVDYELTVCVP
ncbi:MAG: MBL fold metallo-hydrolase [Oscillospiraceae bacterium]|jgi:phosphoribosyl 1,2-cyclic phosphodiesterase|nr:MBL fold metallo-hydrolase [Oscillospiraceae bacterium]